MARRPPARVTLLLGMVLSLTAWSAARLYTALAWRAILDELAAMPGPAYIAATGTAWTAVGLFLLWSIWRGKAWTRPAILAAAGAYGAWAWADRLLIRAWAPPSWPFALVVTILALAYTAWVVLDPDNIPYFQSEAYDRPSED
jgi:hypothetical protein